MSAETNVIKILFVVHLAIACSSTINLSCNTACGKTKGGETSFQGNESCCFEKFAYSKVTRGIPAPVPKLKLNWYIHKDSEGDRMALNITWIDSSSNVFSNDSDGYTLEIIGSLSALNYYYIFRINKEAYVKTQDEAVCMSHYLFGRNRSYEVDPSKTYDVFMQSIPLPHFGMNIDEQNVEISTEPPECSDLNWASTVNCLHKLAHRNHPLVYMTAHYPGTTTSTVKQQPISKKESNPALMPAVIVLSGGILICFVIGLFCLLRTPQGPLPKRKLFVVLSSNECSSKSLYSQAGDDLCCWLRDIGMDVTFTLWNTTVMATTDAIKWVNKNVVEADHVIVIQKSEKDKIITTDAYDHHELNEKESLLNPTFDPYNIVCELIRVRDDAKKKFSAVHFEEKSKKYLDNIFQVQSYRLPEHTIGLLRKISGRRRVKSFFNKKLEEKLADVTQKIRTKTVAENNTNSSLSPLKNKLSTTESIVFIQEHPDSGYYTGQYVSPPVHEDDKLNTNV